MKICMNVKIMKTKFFIKLFMTWNVTFMLWRSFVISYLKTFWPNYNFDTRSYGHLLKRVERNRYVIVIRNKGSRAVDGKMFLESNASSISGTYFRLSCGKVPRIEEAFDSRNLLPSTAFYPKQGQIFLSH